MRMSAYTDSWIVWAHSYGFGSERHLLGSKEHPDDPRDVAFIFSDRS